MSYDDDTEHTADDRPLELLFGSAPSIHLFVVTSQREAFRQVKATPPAVVLVELDKRPQSREKFCNALRARHPALSIVAVADKRPADYFSFDGYVSLPLTEERTQAIVERLHATDSNQVLRCGGIELNASTRWVKSPVGARRLTPKLSALLQLLISNPNELVTRGEIMEAIWETSFLGDTRTLDVHVHWLREAVEPDPSAPEHILTVRGKGYMLVCP